MTDHPHDPAVPPGEASAAPVAVALAVLERQGLWLLQLRDDIAGIVAPGCWGLFGGHLEPGETPEQGLRRELREEIGLEAGPLSPWYRSERQGRVRHVFRGPLLVPLAELRLLEGQDMALVDPQQLRQGEARSPRLGRCRPLAPSLQEAVDALAQWSR